MPGPLVAYTLLLWLFGNGIWQVMKIPAELHAAIEKELEGKSPQALRAAVERVSARYRSAEALPGRRFVDDDEDVMAYVAYRMVATYGATWEAMIAADALLGDWEPHSLLDVGAGTGAATWAALDVWPSIGSARLLDTDARMIDAGKRIAGSSSRRALREACWSRRPIDSLPEDARFDVAVASYVYNEIPVADRGQFIADLWKRAAHVLILVDPGTPRGFEGLRDARSFLVDMGAKIVAPCPHSRACPMAGDDWCHFAARINRTRIHRLVKSGEKSYEDEKFSYVVASREQVAPAASRVIRHPRIRKGQVSVELCAPSGLVQRTYSRRKSGDRYRAARSLRWGDQWCETEL